jgi:hypothetical protein
MGALTKCRTKMDAAVTHANDTATFWGDSYFDLHRLDGVKHKLMKADGLSELIPHGFALLLPDTRSPLEEDKRKEELEDEHKEFRLKSIDDIKAQMPTSATFFADKHAIMRVVALAEGYLMHYMPKKATRAQMKSFYGFNTADETTIYFSIKAPYDPSRTIDYDPRFAIDSILRNHNYDNSASEIHIDKKNQEQVVFFAFCLNEKWRVKQNYPPSSKVVLTSVQVTTQE